MHVRVCSGVLNYVHRSTFRRLILVSTMLAAAAATSVVTVDHERMRERSDRCIEAYASVYAPGTARHACPIMAGKHNLSFRGKPYCPTVMDGSVTRPAMQVTTRRGCS